MDSIRYFLLLLAISFSFGGFTFYTAVVVPIGTDVFDATSQGFITRQVTHVLNMASAGTLLMIVWQAWSLRWQLSRTATIVAVIHLSVYTLCLAVLVVLHPQLDALLNHEEFSVHQPDKFYGRHRVYLWVSTFQWLATFGLVWIYCVRPVQAIQQD